MEETVYMSIQAGEETIYSGELIITFDDGIVVSTKSGDQELGQDFGAMIIALSAGVDWHLLVDQD